MGRHRQELDLSALYDLKWPQNFLLLAKQWLKRGLIYNNRVLSNALQIRNTEAIPQPTLPYFFFVMKNLPTFLRSRTTCPTVFASPQNAWQPSALWKHLSNVYLGTPSTTTSLFHVHSCHSMHTGTSKDMKELTHRCCCPRRATWRENMEVVGY